MRLAGREVCFWGCFWGCFGADWGLARYMNRRSSKFIRYMRWVARVKAV